MSRTEEHLGIALNLLVELQLIVDENHKKRIEALFQSVKYSDYLDQELLNELFPPEFKVGDKVMVTSKRTAESKKLYGKVVELKNVTTNTVSTYTTMTHGMFFDEVRHATPEEIAAAEWEEGKVYRVWDSNGVKRVRVSSNKVGKFYTHGCYEGNTNHYDKYEKL